MESQGDLPCPSHIKIILIFLSLKISPKLKIFSLVFKPASHKILIFSYFIFLNFLEFINFFKKNLVIKLVFSRYSERITVFLILKN